MELGFKQHSKLGSTYQCHITKYFLAVQQITLFQYRITANTSHLITLKKVFSFKNDVFAAMCLYIKT